MKKIAALFLMILLATAVSSMAEGNVVMYGEETLDLSKLSLTDLEDLQGRIEEEIIARSTIITPEESAAVETAVRKAVGNYFSEKNITVEWPSYENAYGKEGTHFTIKTRVAYEDDNGAYMPNVFAEVDRVQEVYQVTSLRIGNQMVFEGQTAAGTEPKPEMASTPVPVQEIKMPEATATPIPVPEVKKPETAVTPAPAQKTPERREKPIRIPSVPVAPTRNRPETKETKAEASEIPAIDARTLQENRENMIGETIRTAIQVQEMYASSRLVEGGVGDQRYVEATLADWSEAGGLYKGEYIILTGIVKTPTTGLFATTSAELEDAHIVAIGAEAEALFQELER